MSDLLTRLVEVRRVDDILRWVAILLASVLAAGEIVDGSAGALVALAIAVGYGVFAALRDEGRLIEDIAFLLAINAAAVTSSAWFAFLPLVVVSLAAAAYRDFAASDAATEPARRPAPVDPPPGMVVDELPRLVAANERRRAVRAADRAEEWLMFAVVGLDNLAGIDPRIAELGDDLEAAVDELRTRVDLVLEAGTDAELTFAERLHQLAEGARELHGWDSHSDIAAEDDVSAPVAPLIRQALLDVAAEALDNAGRHSAAESVTVSWSGEGDARTLSIVDDGLGFDLETVRGAGIEAMARTGRAIGAVFDIASVADQGTAVVVIIPGSRNRGATTTAGGPARSS